MAIYLSKLTADKTTTVNGVKVNECLLKNHNVNGIVLPYKRTKKLLGVTIHNTEDLPRVEDDGEQYTRATLNGNMNTVRVHYYVDELGAWQNLSLDDVNWTCADGKGNGNTATIAIECIMNGQTGENNLKARDNTARLAAWLLYTNGLTADDLYTHTYWLHIMDGKKGDRDYLNTLPHTYKTCPFYIIPKWKEFKALVKQYYNALSGNKQPTKPEATPEAAKDTSFRVRILDDALNIRQAAGTNSKIVGVIKDHGIYTIVETTYVGSTQWGRLKSGAGWISLNSKYVAKL